jgi:hypothetical protein
MTDPLYKTGQVVAIKTAKGEPVFRILEVMREDDGNFYRWDKRNWAAESMLRPLTEAEFK